MRAMVTPQFGGTDLFEEREVERPRPGASEVLVRVVAAEPTLWTPSLGPTVAPPGSKHR
jgi:hypothetical protein